jgi:hypothetical protein
MTDDELTATRRRVSGLHFAKESLNAGERDLLHHAETLLAEVDALRAKLADAWDEGWRAGDHDAYQLAESSQGRADVPIPATNPYRTPTGNRP